METVRTFCKYCKGVSKGEAHASCRKEVNTWKQPINITDRIASGIACPQCRETLLRLEGLDAFDEVRELVLCVSPRCFHYIQMRGCSIANLCKECREIKMAATKEIWRVWLFEERMLFLDEMEELFNGESWYKKFFPYVLPFDGWEEWGSWDADRYNETFREDL